MQHPHSDFSELRLSYFFLRNHTRGCYLCRLTQKIKRYGTRYLFSVFLSIIAIETLQLVDNLKFGAVFIINNIVENVIWKDVFAKNYQMMMKRMSMSACPVTYCDICLPACLSLVGWWENLLQHKCTGWADRIYELAHIRFNLLKNYLGLQASVYVTMSRRNLSYIRKETSCGRFPLDRQKFRKMSFDF